MSAPVELVKIADQSDGNAPRQLVEIVNMDKMTGQNFKVGQNESGTQVYSNESISGAIQKLYDAINTVSESSSAITRNTENTSSLGAQLLRKVGKIAYMYLDVTISSSAASAWTSYVIGNIGAGYRPSKQVNLSGLISIDSSPSTEPWIEINANGDIVLRVRGIALNTQRLYISGMYIL